MAAATIGSAVFSSALPAMADTVTHFGDGVGGDSVSDLLDQVGIGSSNAASETTANTFLIPGEEGTTTDLTFSFVSDTGGFNFTFGYVAMNDALRMLDPASDDKYWWWLMALKYSSPTVIFDDRIHDPGATSETYSMDAGTELLFFLLPNSTLNDLDALVDEALKTAAYPTPTENDALRAPLFSVSDANLGEYDQMLSFIDNGVTLFTFEDLTRAGASDQDFTDLAFLIDLELDTLGGGSGSGGSSGGKGGGSDLPIDPTLLLTAQDVPEPSAVISLLALGAGVFGLRKGKRNQN